MDQECYDGKPHSYQRAEYRTIGSGLNQRSIPILKCTKCGDQSPSEEQLAEMVIDTKIKTLETRLASTAVREFEPTVAGISSFSRFDNFF